MARTRTADATEGWLIVDTRTLAIAAGLSESQIRRYVKRGTIAAIRIRTGRTGRPSMWFDLDISVSALAKRADVRESDQ